ncbi:MAG: zinc ribbon domain-containing protein [Anaerolineales bacterium]|jgi:hypothetical protein
MAKKSMGFVELEWTCPRCNVNNPGPNKFCNGCGAAQPDDVEFHQPVESKILTDKEKIAQAKAGPDIHCPYCNARNPGNVSFCGACGGDLSGGEKRKTGEVVGAFRQGPAGKVECPACGHINPASARQCESCNAPLPRPERKKPTLPAVPSGKGGPVLIILAIACLAVLGILYLLFGRTTEQVGIVRSVAWTRSIEILALMPVEQEAWRDEIPSGSNITNCQSQVRYESENPEPNSVEVCGTPYTVDTGTGFGEVVQDCIYEVYDDYCTYTSTDWGVFDTVTATGSNLQAYWPTVNLSSDQREGDREQEYRITFTTDDDTVTYVTDDPSQFTQFAEGSRWVLEVTATGGVRSAEPAD